MLRLKALGGRNKHLLTGQAFLTFAGRMSGMALQFATVIVIARTLGAAGVGMYSLYSAVLVLVSAFIGIGAPTHSFKVIASYHSKGQHAETKAYVRGIITVVGGVGVCTFVVAWSVLALGWVDSNPALKDILPYAMAGAIGFVILRILFEGMQGVGKLAKAMFVENNVAPMVMMAACAILAWQFDHVRPEWIIVVNMVIFVWLAVILYNDVTREAATQPMPVQKVPVLDRSMLAIWVSTILDMAIINLPTIMAAKFDTLDEVGKFSVAFRFMGVAVSLLMIVRGIAGRQLIVAYAERDIVQCKAISYQMMRYGLAMYLPMILAFVFFGNEILSIFGKSFVGGDKYLLVLGAGQLVYALFGMMGFVLIVMDRSRIEAMVAVASMVLMVGLSVAGQSHGVMAVAVAYAVTIAVRSLVSYVFVIQRFKSLGLSPSLEGNRT